MNHEAAPLDNPTHARRAVLVDDAGASARRRDDSLPAVHQHEMRPADDSVTGIVVASVVTDRDYAVIRDLLGHAPSSEELRGMRQFARLKLAEAGVATEAPLSLKVADLATFVNVASGAAESYCLAAGHRASTLRMAVDGLRDFADYLRRSDATTFLQGALKVQQRVLQQGWLLDLRQREPRLAATTVNHYWRGMRYVFHAIAEERDVADPIAALPIPKFKPGEATRITLTERQVARVLTWVENHDWRSTFSRDQILAYVAILAYTGLRRGETRFLRFGDVNVEDRTLVVRLGKNGKTRTAIIPEALVPYLERYIVQRRRRDPQSDYFLVGVRTDGPIPERTINRLFAAIRRGVGFDLSSQPLRRSFCTASLLSGVPDRLVARAMGHSTQVPLYMYTLFSADDQRRAYQRFTYAEESEVHAARSP